MSINSFRCRRTESLFNGKSVKEFKSIEKIARRKLFTLNSITLLVELTAPPGNRLKALVGDRKGQYSIRLNDQYRICFTWNNGPENVEICDYH